MRTTPLCLVLVGGLAFAGPVLGQTQPPTPRGDAAVREIQRQHGTDPAVPAVPHQNRAADAADARDGGWATTRDWLVQAQAAIGNGNLDMANELLERAATRMLSRSTDPALASLPMYDMRLRHITMAREAVLRRDRDEAGRLIGMALADG